MNDIPSCCSRDTVFPWFHPSNVLFVGDGADESAEQKAGAEAGDEQQFFRGLRALIRFECFADLQNTDLVFAHPIGLIQRVHVGSLRRSKIKAQKTISLSPKGYLVEISGKLQIF